MRRASGALSVSRCSIAMRAENRRSRLCLRASADARGVCESGRKGAARACCAGNGSAVDRATCGQEHMHKRTPGCMSLSLSLCVCVCVAYACIDMVSKTAERMHANCLP